MPEDGHSPAQTLANPLAERLHDVIAKHGPMRFYDFAASCLYDETHGYYRHRDPLGQQGDFITAPEISQVFGELTGLWAADVWAAMGRPQTVRFIEFGPGRGTLMADALRACKAAPDFLAACQVELIECSQGLLEQQKRTLDAAPTPVAWHETIETVPQGPAIIIANEFLDCLPIRQYVYSAKDAAWHERVVASARDGAFHMEAGDMAEQPPALPSAQPADGDIFEYRPGTESFCANLGQRAAFHPLAALVMDYGHDRSAYGDTVQAVRRHGYADVLLQPGETDITSHVDFENLRQTAARAGLETYGPMPMGEFLLRLGLEARASQLLRNAEPPQRETVLSGIGRLIDPARIGLLFKVLALTSAGLAAPAPFMETAQHDRLAMEPS